MTSIRHFLAKSVSVKLLLDCYTAAVPQTSSLHLCRRPVYASSSPTAKLQNLTIWPMTSTSDRDCSAVCRCIRSNWKSRRHRHRYSTTREAPTNTWMNNDTWVLGQRTRLPHPRHTSISHQQQQQQQRMTLRHTSSDGQIPVAIGIVVAIWVCRRFIQRYKSPQIRYSLTEANRSTQIDVALLQRMQLNAEGALYIRVIGICVVILYMS